MNTSPHCADGGATISQACREVGISEATFHRWQREYGAMSRTSGL
ncbi:helix-turn-helix domain-containing protein [Corynebacterium auriscanis]|nr:helix-turn-helix domain-containing protein [Corynebacterium auriscanis]